MALGDRSCVPLAKTHPQRHITAVAAEEPKLDGYRALAVNSEGKRNLLSRRRNSLNRQYSLLLEALAELPDNTVIDGEVVALNEFGRPDFHLLQHYGRSLAHSLLRV